jgi:hypothetical protein
MIDISQKTGKKIPLDIETNEPHDCPVRKNNTQQQHNKHNKGGFIHVKKATVRKSILMQTLL